MTKSDESVMTVEQARKISAPLYEAEVFEGMGQTVPDLAWEVVDIHVVDDLMIVRGEATGTPAAEFWGAAPALGARSSTTAR